MSRFFAKVSLLLLMSISWAHATTINYTATQVGGVRWRYDYTIHNDTLGSTIQEFTIYFGENRFANLSNESVQPNWDLLLIQPDTNIPAAGFFDGLALNGGLVAGETVSGLSVSFDYAGAGAPGQQLFSIVDPVSFAEIESGLTSGATAVPLPGTLSLLVLGLAAGAAQRRRQGGAQ